jgi:hypothetical protein
MLSNKEFTHLERRLWREGNPLCDELVSTRDELLFLLSQAQTIIKKYSPMVATLSADDDLVFFKEWDTFIDSVENLDYGLGE